MKAPVESGAKLGVSIDEEEYRHLEKVFCDACNKSRSLTAAVERYKNRRGHYPERLLADQIYRTKGNQNIRENGVTLKNSEKNHAWACQSAREFTKEFLGQYNRDSDEETG